MKPGGKDGKLYKSHYGDPIQGGDEIALKSSGFYRIKSVGVATALPQPKEEDRKKGARALGAGDIAYLWKGQKLAEGDAVEPMFLKLIGFVKDVSNSKQGQTFDVSTQENLDSGVREYITGAFTESSGTINGTVETDSEEQRELLNQFASVAVSDGEHYAVFNAKETKQDYMLSRRETETVGETAVWEHFPVTVESLNMDKPLDGEQNFNFNYKVDGGNHPGVIYYTVRDENAAVEPDGDTGQTEPSDPAALDGGQTGDPSDPIPDNGGE